MVTNNLMKYLDVIKKHDQHVKYTNIDTYTKQVASYNM